MTLKGIPWSPPRCYSEPPLKSLPPVLIFSFIPSYLMFQHWLGTLWNGLEKIDWTKAWGKKYPILLTYTRDVNVENYAVRLEAMIGELRAEYGYSELDAFLVLKDILASVWKGRKKKS